jgi:hypothetical protein
MSSSKNCRRFEIPCLHLQGQAVQDLLDPRTIHQSTRQPPKNYICGTRTVSNSNLFYDLLVSIFVTPTFLVSSLLQHNFISKPTHLQYICHCHVIPLHILLPKVFNHSYLHYLHCLYWSPTQRHR